LVFDVKVKIIFRGFCDLGNMYGPGCINSTLINALKKLTQCVITLKLLTLQQL